jgi:hypothetical protein
LGEEASKSTADCAAQSECAVVTSADRHELGRRAGIEPHASWQTEQGTRGQIAMAARLLRSIRPAAGEVEIALHEIARRLEQIADTGTACRTSAHLTGWGQDALTS